MKQYLLTILASLAFCSGASGYVTTVDGMDIYWTSAGSGPAIVLVHGWTCDTTAWTDQIAELSNNYRVIALDLPGHGLSDSPQTGELSIALYARAVEAVRVNAGVDDIVLIGHSMGVPVISQYASAYPERVSGLIGVDGALLPSQNPPLPEPPAGPFSQVREQAIRGMFIAETPVHVQERALHMMLSPSDERAIAAGLSLFTFSIDKDKPIEEPVLLVLAGTADKPDREAITRSVPNMDIQIMEGTGHFLMMEKPAEFNRLVQRFLVDIDF